MDIFKVNGVARGQYKQLCPISYKKCKGQKKLINYKIQRAAVLGKVTQKYKNGCIIIRYHHLNFLVGGGEIMTIWSDKSRKSFDVSEDDKDGFDTVFFDKLVK